MTRPTPRGVSHLALLSILVLIFTGSSASSQSLEPFTVRIDRVNLTTSRDEISVNVALQAGWANMSGFDFLIAYENGPLKIKSITPGDLGNLCDWEYFAWRSGRNGPRDEYNRTTDTIRVSAAASLNLDHLPACYTLEPKPVTLFTMKFQVVAGSQWTCTYSPIRFYWLSCYDNRISVPASIMPMPHDEVETIAQRVFEPTGWEISGSRTTLPGFFGPPSGCVSMAENSPVPYINLVNGGITFAAGCKPDLRGDINLNGTPYEIEDSWIFAKYLLFGDTTLRRAALEATDMNRDSRPGTVEDLVLLMRAVLGEYTPANVLALDAPSAKSNPFAPPAPRPARVDLSFEDNELLLTTADTLVAARLVFSGRVSPHLYNKRLDLYESYIDGETRLLIYGFFTDATFTSGPFLYWEGSGRLKEASFATSGGGKVDVHIRR